LRIPCKEQAFALSIIRKHTHPPVWLEGAEAARIPESTARERLEEGGMQEQNGTNRKQEKGAGR